MIYIKLFDTESEYLTYRNGGGYVKPNVSFCNGNSKVYYNLNANGHDYVDLGLPSGTLWATMNVGASKPSDDGLYFQWGDTLGYTESQIGTGSGKKKFASDWSDYKWYLSGSEDKGNLKFKKYTKNGDALALEDDAAHVNMGGDWHMPSSTQIDELIKNTKNEYTALDGRYGMKFTSKKDRSKFIFIPDGNNFSNGSRDNDLIIGDVWSSGFFINDYDNGAACGDSLIIDVNEEPYTPGIDFNECYKGCSVRGVIG